jgi:hypothetical protein
MTHHAHSTPTHPPQYYSLDIAFFKSSLDAALLDLLWNSYWVNTLSASPLIGACAAGLPARPRPLIAPSSHRP